MLRIFRIVIFLLLCAQAAVAQSVYSLSGSVHDAETSEPLIGVALSFVNTTKGVTTDLSGKFSIWLPQEPVRLKVSYLGYQEKVLEIQLSNDSLLQIYLVPAPIQTKEVVVNGQRRDENLFKTTDHIRLSKKEIEQLPFLFGEVDPIKAIQLLPGVQNSGEGNGGIFVRGGGIDQNLVLFDQAPVYNTGHLFGFFSLFNNAFLDKVELLKGGIPADYGGRLSSVLEVRSRQGNKEKLSGSGSIGLVSANFLLEGPIQHKKSAFSFAGRRTYIDLLSKAVTSDPTIFNTGIDYFFDDVNTRLDFRLSERDQLAISGYRGTDNFFFSGKNRLTNTIRWKNTTASVRWEHFYQAESSHEITFLASSYAMNFSAGIQNYRFALQSGIADLGVKARWQNMPHPKHTLTYGAEYIHHSLIPNNIKAQGSDFEFTLSDQQKLYSQEEALFIQDAYRVSNDLNISAGLRFSMFQQLGPFTRYQVDQNLAIQDTVRYAKRELVKNWWMLDPRLAITYRLNDEASLKVSVDKMHQYLHMAPVSSVSLPTDVWVPSSEKLAPQNGIQYAVGYFRNFKQNRIESSVSVYYKHMSKQLEYRDGVIVGYSKGYNYDDIFLSGKGRSYGLEFFLKKNTGPLTGWLSYTISRTERTFNQINRGSSFPAKHDRPHNLNLTGAYKLNQRWSFASVFVFSSGNALTLPVGRYIINGNIINEYEGRNTFQMPAYHRLDVSAIYQLKPKNKNFESSLTFSVYNLYNRKNPYYIYFATEGNVNDYYLKVSLEKVSLFPIIPAVAYQFKF